MVKRLNVQIVIGRFLSSLFSNPINFTHLISLVTISHYPFIFKLSIVVSRLFRQ